MNKLDLSLNKLQWLIISSKQIKTIHIQIYKKKLQGITDEAGVLTGKCRQARATRPIVKLGVCIRRTVNNLPMSSLPSEWRTSKLRTCTWINLRI